MPTELKDLVFQFALISFFMPLIMGSILVWFIVTYQRKKFLNEVFRKDVLLREQALIIEKHQALENERTRIASEMHDDLGSGLTTIRYLSDRALKQASDPQEVQQIKRISEHSNNLVRNMSEIIWAMNARFDNAENLVGYLRRYASEFLTEHQIGVKFETNYTELDSIEVTGEKRRNLFLVVKELLNNTVKYSGAHDILINIKVGDHFQITISETDGKGFKTDEAMEKGNGLFNCEKRMTSIGGRINFIQTGHGTDVTFSAPLTS